MGNRITLRRPSRALLGTVVLLPQACCHLPFARAGGSAPAATRERPAPAPSRAWRPQDPGKEPLGPWRGEIFLENRGTKTCGLGGYPRLALRDQSGRMLPVMVIDADPHLLPPAVRRPRSVTLAPQQQLGTGFTSNGSTGAALAPGPVSPRLVLPGGGTLHVEPMSASMNFSGRARCDDRTVRHGSSQPQFR